MPLTTEELNQYFSHCIIKYLSDRGIEFKLNKQVIYADKKGNSYIKHWYYETEKPEIETLQSYELSDVANLWRIFEIKNSKPSVPHISLEEWKILGDDVQSGFICFITDDSTIRVYNSGWVVYTGLPLFLAPKKHKPEPESEPISVYEEFLMEDPEFRKLDFLAED